VKAEPDAQQADRTTEIAASSKRDAFLSHRGVDKPFVRRLAADLESTPHRDRTLSVWLDEAEIRPGQSIPGMINQGLECSRFIVLVLTPAYFNSESGWTDAEWHAALHRDPDNRRNWVIPVLAADCPYVPMLLRHLLSLDMRGSNYDVDLRRLVAILRDEPLPRPISYRGQLIRSNGRIDRTTLLAERAVPEGDPDVVEENLSCNLLPVERMPTFIYEAPIRSDLCTARLDGTHTLPTKAALRDIIKQSQLDAGEERPLVPAFRVVGGRIVSFHDLESDESRLASVVDQESMESTRVLDAVRDEDDRRVVVSLLNMSLDRHMMSCGLLIDKNYTRGSRFYFPADNGAERVVKWKPFRNEANRTVTKPYLQGEAIVHWLHQAAVIRVVFLASRFFVQISPSWLLTHDGERVKGGSDVARVVNRWTARERNLSVLYHVRFWTSILRRGPGRLIAIRVGEETMDVATVPAFVRIAYGIADDQRDVLRALDEAAPRIALEEEQIEIELRSEGDEDDETLNKTEGESSSATEESADA
jgi:hypothetical protein